MKTNLTELVFILDRSGSMSGLESDTIGGFNSLIEKQKSEDGECFVTTVLFDHENEIVHDRIALSEISKMTEKEYYTRGTTALLDAMGTTIKHIEKIQKYARKEDRPEKTLFIITTDGYENASRKFSLKEVKKLVEQKKEIGWEFLFLGANIDAVETARDFGIAEDRAVTYLSDDIGTKTIFQNLSSAVSFSRAGKDITREWKSEIEEDYEKRKQFDLRVSTKTKKATKFLKSIDKTENTFYNYSVSGSPDTLYLIWKNNSSTR